MFEIKDDFWNENGRSLKKPDLVCLRQDHYTYKSLLFQLKGEIEFDKNGIRLNDKTTAFSKFKSFFDIAIEEEIDLAITPEYSCPWSNIDTLINDNKLPSEGKIWIIGCQSIKSKEITSLIQKHKNVIWIYDDKIVNNINNADKFFDPVCLVFKTKDENNVIKTVIIIQLKTNSFGGKESIWERDNAVYGNTLYVIENESKSTKLVTLICSDTLQNIDFNTIQGNYFLNDPLLLIHIQLNEKPFNPSYKIYRDIIFSKGKKENYNKEIICLNWARNVTYKDNENNLLVHNYYSGSALYCKTNEIDINDERINNNHKKGLYYVNWENKRTHIYFLNYEEYVFLIENTKPSQLESNPEQGYRTGPICTKIYKWNNTWESIAEPVDSGFINACNDIDNGAGDLDCLINNLNYIEVERLVLFVSGDFELINEWHNIKNLRSFKVDEAEINNLITFRQDPNITISELIRNKLLLYYFLKNNILTDSSQTPPIFVNSDLRFDHSSNNDNNYLTNLHSTEINLKGTAIYLGITQKHIALAFQSKLDNLLKKGHQNIHLLIWYNNPILNKLHLNIKPKATSKRPKSLSSINKTS